MKTKPFLFSILSAVLSVLAVSAASTDTLESGFLNPPDSAKPQTWWHWMNGNITKVGITADLEAMKQIGLGGATVVNADCGIPRGPVPFMSPEWQDDFKFAVDEAHRLGLELCVENCAGWSSSGGPWITPTNAMQRITACEIRVSGPRHYESMLPKPPVNLGFYHDIAVLAFPDGTNLVPAIGNLDAKAGFSGDAVESSTASDNLAAGVIARNHIIDLTSRLRADGQLNWKIPTGKWIILRVGYTPTGVNNHPAPLEGTGLECDKLDPSGLDAHWAGFMQKVLVDIGPLAGTTLDASFIDSYEVGGQNWSKNFRAEFMRRRGYDPVKFLPVFTGRFVESPEASEGFLWDVRRTIADLFAENYYGHFAELCRQNGLLSMVEPYTGPFESLQSGKPEDLVMGEFWAGSQGDPSVRVAASVAHIYGKTIVGTESFTAGPDNGRWQNDPYSFKALGDLMFCEGVNRYTFHRYAMQPWTNRWPGMTMGQWGFHFERTETWWNQGKPWIAYISRSQFLLQQGRSVQDVAYFDGQSAPVERRDGTPTLPKGYDFDAVDAGVLLHGATVKDGRLTLASGANYAVLVLPPDDINMTPDVLKEIGKLIHNGATVVGPCPQHSPSLDDYPASDRQVKGLAKKIWGDCNGTTVLEHKYGKGRVIWGESLADVFSAQNLEPDFEFHGNDRDTSLTYTHRTTGTADIYFVSNQREKFDSAECVFRVSGKTPELWDAQTGTIRPAPIWHEEAGRTYVQLGFEPAGSVFVVFRKELYQDHMVSAEFHEAASPEPPSDPNLQIMHAAYGYFAPASQPWMDITEKVKNLASSGTNEIPANNDFAGDDPAPNVVKQLRVEYDLGGSNEALEVRENGSLVVPESATIVKALYGELDTTNRIVDLTEKLESLVKHGRLSVRADNALVGNDPTPNIPKELRVDYLLNSVTKQITVPENEMLELPATLNIGTAPQSEFGITADGSPTVTFWENGLAELRLSGGQSRRVSVNDVPPPQEVAGPWALSFPPDWGAPPSVTLEHLISWIDSTNSGVRYFSGTATYEKDMEIPADSVATGRELWLDLGDVKNFAEVSLNGQDFGTLWKPPFRVNITAAVKPGTNKLLVKVTNLWPNRLIGDEQLPPDCEWDGKQLKAWPQWLLEGKPSPTGRLTFTTWHHYTKDSSLLESGLIGPVTLRTTETITAK
ncbi:MAG TPA: glycosyl hydrolase [Pseudomonadales bacterium]|nr:glycosyl hydrolase [Pseudomonadales bacterium]